MGWDFIDGMSKQGVIKYLTKDTDCSTVLKKACYGNELWVLHEINSTEKVITLYLLRRDKGSYGFKEITESMFPYYFKCPLGFLEKAPVKNQPWRDGVIKYHNDKAMKNARAKRSG